MPIATIASRNEYTGVSTTTHNATSNRLPVVSVAISTPRTVALPLFTILSV
jgi:hypothetical protein